MAVPDRRLTVPSKKPWEGSIPRGPWALDPCCMVGFQLGGSRFHLKALGRGLPAQTSYIALCLWYNFALNLYIGRSRSRGADTNCLNIAGARLCFDVKYECWWDYSQSRAGQPLWRLDELSMRATIQCAWDEDEQMHVNIKLFSSLILMLWSLQLSSCKGPSRNLAFSRGPFQFH